MFSDGAPAVPGASPGTVVPARGAVLCRAVLCTREVALITVAMVLCAGAGAAGGLFPAPPPQLFGLWQPLQSLPT